MAPKHRQLDLAFFTPTTKEEREKDAKKDTEMEFACLNKGLDKECAMANNIELAIHALDQVHCWGAYFCPGIGTMKILPP
jgi:hypothetical protein